MTSILEKAGRFWHEFSGRLGVRRDTAPIDSVATLREFVGTRSAYLAQKTLYDYVKARMGTRYPLMFEDATLMKSLNIAKLHVFSACLSDLTIFAVGTALHDQPVDDLSRRELALRCYREALDENTGDATEPFSAQDYVEAFAQRLDDTDWRYGARQPENFTASPRALFRWAPIADQLKRFDSEIVENSIKFGWRDIREQFLKRIDAGAVGADWGRQTPAD